MTVLADFPGVFFLRNDEGDAFESVPSSGAASHVMSAVQESGRDYPYVDALIYGCLEPLGRSFLVYYFLACLHLVLFACKQRPQTPVINKGIRRGRSALKGAPLWLAFAVVAHLLPVAHRARACGA